MVPKPTLVKHDFSLAQTVAIPRRLAEYRRGNRTLFVAIAKASSVVTDNIGCEFIYLFEAGIPLGEAMARVSATYGPDQAERVISSLRNLLTQIESRGFYESARPDSASFEQHTLLARLTNRCNLRCTHCLVSSSPEWPIDNDLTTEQWLETMEGFVGYSRDSGIYNPRVTITGGEALVRKDALLVAKRAKSLGAQVELFSNAVLIVNSRIAGTIADAVTEVQISFDGATAPVHDAVRGAGMFERTVKGAIHLREAGVKFHLSIVVMPQNFDDLLAHLPSLVRSIGEGVGIRLGLAVKQGRAKDDMVYPSLAAGEEKVQVLIDKMSDLGIRAPRPHKPNLRAVSCGYSREITVNSDGLVYSCGPQQFPVGDLKTEPFLTIAHRCLTNAKATEIDHVEGCRDCNIRYLCGGTCRLNNISQRGRADVSCCDNAEKEKNISLLFGRASNIVPIEALLSSTQQVK